MMLSGVARLMYGFSEEIVGYRGRCGWRRDVTVVNHWLVNGKHYTQTRLEYGRLLNLFVY